MQYDDYQDYSNYDDLVDKLTIKLKKEISENQPKPKLKIKSGLIGVDILQQINKLGER